MDDPEGAGLPLRRLDQVAWAYGRYNRIFEDPDTIQERIPNTDYLDTGITAKSPWIIEAPLNTVQIIEAILKPKEPFQVYTAHHFPRGCVAVSAYRGNRKQELYREYCRFQGRLERDRQINFIMVTDYDIWAIRDATWAMYTPTILNYISIPWSFCERKTLVNPWALVFHGRNDPVTQDYQHRLELLVDKLDIAGRSIDSRSYLRPGTIPLPECIWDWFAGIPGKEEAAPYYWHEDGAYTIQGESARDTVISDSRSNGISEILNFLIVWLQAVETCRHLGKASEQKLRS
ncbi:unnamed protein product [Clonostachys byssicola]|uniref:Uncharacterized protein n=1 Tax=Clonostachys byssicola TaxID=160290 RepID=A0A9N9U837_9HYPO|nr:unnamed protein product [Clonostachys byssicola]